MNPQATGLNGNGTLYLAEGYDGKIYIISQSGTITTIDSGFKHPKQVIITPVGDIYVINTDRQIIQRISPDRRYTSLAKVGKSIIGTTMEGKIIYMSYRDTISQVDPYGTITPVLINQHPFH